MGVWRVWVEVRGKLGKDGEEVEQVFIRDYSRAGDSINKRVIGWMGFRGTTKALARKLLLHYSPSQPIPDSTDAAILTR